MNNCATRTALSGVMGLGLGVLFGIFMGTMDGAVSRYTLNPTTLNNLRPQTKLTSKLQRALPGLLYQPPIPLLTCPFGR
jgi:hypothetical protein